MLALAAAEEALEAEVREFDADPELLNCTNGVVNLRSGACLPHSPATASRGSPARPTTHGPSAGVACPPRAHLRGRHGDHRFPAAPLRVRHDGLSREQVFVVFFGEGANGKSDTVFGMSKALGSGGSIAIRSPRRSRLSRRIERPHPQQPGCPGWRAFVTTSEHRIGQTLDESLIKEITGGEDITARFLHREDFSFRPQFLLLISTNHKPRVEAPDFAFKRRVLLVPFNVTLSESEWDRHHAEKLAAELDGILAWGVEGAVEYLAHGLRVPEKVRAATEAYRERWIRARFPRGVRNSIPPHSHPQRRIASPSRSGPGRRASKCS